MSEPMYRVSPQLFVTNEHIISDRASTSPSFSSSGLPLFRFSAFFGVALFCGSGDAIVLLGVEWFSSFGDVCVGDVGFDPGCCDNRNDSLFVSASLFSNVPKSEPSSVSSPRSRKSCTAMRLPSKQTYQKVEASFPSDLAYSPNPRCISL
jgi:hypothetical protein